MAINSAALSLIKRFEGLKTTAYLCPSHIPTIGFGHTRTVTRDDIGKKKITESQAEKLLGEDLKRFEADVSRLVKAQINENQYGALVSFAYNIGPGAFAGSTLLRKLNSGDVQGAAKEFERWNRGGGKILNGLVKRRAAEKDLFLSPVKAPAKKTAKAV